ncbi:alpha/beta hydrolase [Fodinicurvata sp. EGI_FJ10296]|uniref:alpha/beta fold hydrolase n=1 Tax=Fodinicurvata sp. EGI_FJ10296 TaxID=3231908 RepID=UPI003452428A
MNAAGLTSAEPAVRRRPVDLDISGVRLYGEWVEPEAAGDRAPLVFLHEGLGSVRQWVSGAMDVPATIAAATGRRAFVYDRLGFGRSPALTRQRQPDYLYDEALETLPAVIEALGLETCVPVGHSDGATIALILAARRPDLVAGLVIEAPHVVVESRTLAGIRAAQAAFDDPEGRLRPGLERYHGEKTAATFSGWADVWLTPEFARFSMLDDLPGITAPLLVIQGEDDEYGTPRQLDLIVAGVGGPVSTRMIPGCRHIPHFQAFDSVMPLMADFIAPLP